MSELIFSEAEYLRLILNYLKNDSKISELPKSKELKENDLDISSNNFFKSLYYNLLFFFKKYGKNNISTEKQKYFYFEIVELLEIIYEFAPDCFIEDDYVKSVLIYVIYSLKKRVNINTKIILKIFLGFRDVFETISCKKIEEKVYEFEKENIETIIYLINRYQSDFQEQLKKFDKNSNFKDIIFYLKRCRKSFPLYLKGFIKYACQINSLKFLTIKIYNYFKILNPYTKDNLNAYNLYQGYSLYGILSYENESDELEFSFEKFNKIKNNRIKDINARTILELSIKLLTTKTNIEFINILNKEYIDVEVETPKVSNNYNNNSEYYKELYKQLSYYLNEYKKNSMKYKICKILSTIYLRIFWLNFNKRLLLNLEENDLEKDEIKIIFYFIVNLFNPDVNEYTSLEFSEDAVPILFNQFSKTNIISDDKELFKIIDKNYSQYYPNFDKEDKFLQTYINTINEELLNNSKIKNFMNENLSNKIEINNIIKYNKDLPFPLLQKHLKKSKINIKEIIQNLDIYSNLLNFYEDCFCDLEDNDKQFYIEKIRKINASTDDYNINKIKGIINDNKFLNLIKEIMISPVMKDAYNHISNWYLSNGKIGLDEDIQNSNENENLINGKSLFFYYEKYCDLLKTFKLFDIFIIMKLPERFKGFTFRFLKIVLNSEGIKYNSENEKDNINLLKAYLIYVIIHEQNHYIKRFLNINIDTKLCKTPKINNNDEGEGGKLLIKLLFGDELIKKALNLKQAEYILNINNWKKKSVKEFRNDFLAIKTEEGEKSSIIYLSSEFISICDHSKLVA